MSRYSVNRPVWMEKPSPVLTLLKVVVLTMFVAVVVYPFLVVVSTSISTEGLINRAGGLVTIPTEISFKAYQQILSGGVVTRALIISVCVTAIGTLLSLTCTVLAAYGLSRPDSFGHRALLTIVLLTLLFTPGIIPNYLAVKSFGLLDNYAALIVPTAINAFNLIVMRNFFLSIPQELLDAARVDGATDAKVLWSIVLPLSRAVVAVIGMFYGVAYWNSFFSALLYMSDTSKWPLQLVLRIFVLQGQAIDTSAVVPPPQQALQMAIVVLAVLPILFAFPFVQRHFTKGVITGAIKG